MVGVAVVADEGALIIYGNGAELGNFKFFVDDLATTELNKKYGKNVRSVYVNRGRGLLNELINHDTKKWMIKELHIFSHSIGAGMFLGYHDDTINRLRQATYTKPDGTIKRARYEDVVAAEIGSVLTDHLVIPPFSTSKMSARAAFSTKDALIKIWGCNSGVINWVYWDGDDPSAPYYWAALNEKNVPKPALAQAFADYFNQTTYGATSGASIQVFHKGMWKGADVYKKETGKWAGEPQILRLHPDKGNYAKYVPSGK
jgi:hypothetical protein